MTNPFKKLKLRRRVITWLSALHLFGNPSARMEVVGVTGTNGKTTTAMLLYEVAQALGHKSGLIGTVENRIGEERILATHTTPDPLQLNRLLRRMSKEGCRYVFMEVSSHAIHQNRTAGVKFTGGIFTNLTHDHLDYHKSLDRYYKAKKKFFKSLSNKAFALSNADDEYGERMVSGIKARRFFYAFEKKADFYGKIKKIDFKGLQLEINGEEIKSGMIGKFNAYNLLAVWSVCSLLGFDMKKVSGILAGVKPPPGRFEPFVSSSGVLVVIDFAHTPDALEKVLLAGKGILPEGGRVISIVGCGGDKDKMKRPKMGKIGAGLSDISIFTSDNPRSENPEKIIEDMKASLSQDLSVKVKTIPNRREAISKSIQIAKPGDIIICTGKGHEDYQEIKGVKYPFHDTEEFKKII